MGTRPVGILMVPLLAAVVVGCGQPVPPDRAEYVGQWRGGDVWLEITAGGRVEYRVDTGTFSKSISGPIQSFQGDDFEVGIWFLTTTFEVDKPPYQQEGTWKMVVEGVELTRLD